MTLPASIRVNTRVPFPTLIYGSAPVTISKVNGIWTIGLAIDPLGAQVPASGSYSTDYFLVWDSVVKTYFKMSLTGLISTLSIAVGQVRAQRTTAVTPIVVGAGDEIISTKITSAAACTLPLASSRAGKPLTFKDLGQAGANNITFTTTGGDLIDGLASYVLNINYAGVSFVPFNDGTNTGWMVQ